MNADDFPQRTTIVFLTAPGDSAGMHRLLIYGEPEGLIEKMRAAAGLPFKVDMPGRRGHRSTIWLNPYSIAYFRMGGPVGSKLSWDGTDDSD